MKTEEEFLREAIRLSIDKMHAGEGGPFGAIVVRNGEVVGQGWNRVLSTLDPTAHAEVVAIRDACRNLKSFSLEGCRIYASCEPCPMCLAAIYWARIESIDFAATTADAAAAGFDDGWFYEELTRPAESRSVPMRQSLQSEAIAAFHHWLQKPDRIPY